MPYTDSSKKKTTPPPPSKKQENKDPSDLARYGVKQEVFFGGGVRLV